jgi:hypothetical protein
MLKSLLEKKWCHANFEITENIITLFFVLRK